MLKNGILLKHLFGKKKFVNFLGGVGVRMGWDWVGFGIHFDIDFGIGILAKLGLGWVLGLGFIFD